MLENNFNPGEKVTPKTLLKKGLVAPADAKKSSSIKVLDRGNLSKKLIFENISASKPAAEKIFAQGGEIRQVK